MAYYVDLDYYDDEAELLVELWAEIENELIEEIAKRVSATGITYTGEFKARQLAEANLLNKRAVQLISEKSGLSNELVEQIIHDVGLDVAERDEYIYRQAAASGQLTFDPLPVDKSPALEKTLEGVIENARSFQDTIRECTAEAQYGLSNLTNTRMMNAGNGKFTLTKAARLEYYNTCNLAFLQVRTGNKTVADATRSACMTLADKGIYITHWESGHNDTIEVSVRRNIRTAMAQTSGKMTLSMMGDYQHDLVEVSSHMGARPSHAVWQGGIYSLTGAEGYENFYEATGYGTLLGLCGVNCRHRFFPYFPGTTPAFEHYDEEENLKAYEITQEQRALERNIRAAKRKEAAAKGLGEDHSEESKTVRSAQAAMRKFIKEHPQTRRRYDREQIYIGKEENK